MSSPVSERGYARPELLADTDWLAAHMSDPRLRILDARSADEYAAGHIEGAIHFDGFFSIPRVANNDMAPPEAFAAKVGPLGIGSDNPLVVYDSPSQRMGMVAWAFLYYGHPDVRILDGGMTKWLAEGRPVTTAVAGFPPVAYSARPVEAVYCSLEGAKAGVERADFVFWDTRSRAEYEGKQAGFGATSRLGHLPGAAHMEWTELLDPTTRVFKPGTELRQILEASGITPDKEVAPYCGGGARGALGAYVLQVLGFDRAPAYAGSFQQWANEPDTAVEL